MVSLLLTWPWPVQGDCTPPPSGLVSWWAAEGDGSDNVVRNPATLQNMGFGTGEVGQAFVFNGTNTYIRVPASASLNVGLSNGFTLEAWMNPATLDRRPLFEWNQTTNGWAGMGVHVWLSYNGSGDLYADLLDSGGNDHIMGTATGVVSANSFQHVALTYDKTTGLAVFYRNGVVVLSTNLGIFTPQTSFDLYMGRRPWATGPYADQYLKGMLDEASLYNRALASNEIAAIYNAGTNGKCALWPVILSQPTNQAVVAGTNVSFSVAAGGDSSLIYQWHCNGTNLPAGTNATLDLLNVQSVNAGTYSVLVTNRYGSALSSNAVLTVFPRLPTILVQPVDQKIWVSNSASFSVTVTGAPSLFFQWSCNGTNIADATNITLSLTNVQFSQAGYYTVLVTNVYGSTLSSGAYLAVRTPGTVLAFNQSGLQAAMAAAATVIFDSDGVIALTSQIAVTNTTTIDGSGHNVTISGGNAVGLFSINSGVSAAFINLTLTNGRVTGTNGVAEVNGQTVVGGAILNNGGTVALTGCTVVSNLAVGGAGFISTGSYPYSTAGGAGLGGAIYNLAGNLYATNCSFIANGVTGGAGGRGFSGMATPAIGGDACGGAIYSLGGNATVQSSTFIGQKIQGGTGGSASYPSYPASDGNAYGGAVWFSNTIVDCYNSTFTSNSAAGASAEGGAIFLLNGTASCVGCMFITNTISAGPFSSAVAQGGAIWCQASVSVSQCSFLGNQATGNGRFGTASAAGEGSGGAIFNANAVTVAGSTFANNVAAGGYGGIRSGGFNQSGGPGRGGAICCSGTVLATNCTLAANCATGGMAPSYIFGGSVSGGNGTGGGIYINTGTVTLVNLTSASNSAAGGAGGLGGPTGASAGGALCNSNGTVNLYNTILAYSPSGSNCWGTVLDYGYNLSSDNSAGFYMTGSLNNADPKLGPLGNYGGPTLTLALLAGSPAIDAIPAAKAPATDQRGRPRPYGAASDIGALEWPPLYLISGIVSGLPAASGTIVSTGSSNATVDASGHYQLNNLDAGSYVVTPSNANYAFVPNSRSVTLGPNQFNVNFQAYGLNFIYWESVSNRTMHLRYAGTNGQTCRVLTTTNLTGQWLPVATNVLSGSNYLDLFLPVTSERGRFYRIVSP